MTSSAFETEPPQAVRHDLIFNIKKSAGSSISTVITTIVMETLPDDQPHVVNRLQGIALKPVLRDQPEPDQRVVIARWHDQRLTVSERCDRVLGLPE